MQTKETFGILPRFILIKIHIGCSFQLLIMLTILVVISSQTQRTRVPNCHSEHSHMYIKDHLLHWQKKKAMLQLEKGSKICMCELKSQLCCYYYPPMIRCSRIQPCKMVPSASLLCRSTFALASLIHCHLVAPALRAAKSVLASACSHSETLI